jgi:hypothetical protein
MISYLVLLSRKMFLVFIRIFPFREKILNSLATYIDDNPSSFASVYFTSAKFEFIRNKTIIFWDVITACIVAEVFIFLFSSNIYVLNYNFHILDIHIYILNGIFLYFFVYRYYRMPLISLCILIFSVFIALILFNFIKVPMSIISTNYLNIPLFIACSIQLVIVALLSILDRIEAIKKYSEEQLRYDVSESVNNNLR